MTPAHWLLLAACMTMAICAGIYLLRESDADEWRNSSLRQPKPDNTTPPHSPAEATEARKGPFQSFVEYPILQPFVGMTLGFWIPGIFIFLAIGDTIEDTRFELVAFYGLILIWNLCFLKVFRFHLRLPILPIPIVWVSVLLIGIGLYDLCFGQY